MTQAFAGFLLGLACFGIYDSYRKYRKYQMIKKLALELSKIQKQRSK